MNKYLLLGFSALHLFPHPMGVSPVGAIAIYAGALGDRRLAWLVPLIPMLLKDSSIGFYDSGAMASVYGGTILSVFMGQAILSQKRSFFRYIAAFVGGASVFFFVANCGIFYSGGNAIQLTALFAYYQNGLPHWGIGVLANIGFGLSLFALHARLSHHEVRVEAISR